MRWNPTFQLFVFLLRLLLLLGTATTLFTGLLVCTFGHDVCVCGLCVRRVRTSTVHTAIAQHVCVDRFCACVMLREHVTCATTTYCCRSIKLFKVNNNELFESAKLYLQIRLSSDVVRRPSRVVVGSSCILYTIASPRHRAPQNRTYLETDAVHRGV